MEPQPLRKRKAQAEETDRNNLEKEPEILYIKNPNIGVKIVFSVVSKKIDLEENDLWAISTKPTA